MYAFQEEVRGDPKGLDDSHVVVEGDLGELVNSVNSENSQEVCVVIERAGF